MTKQLKRKRVQSGANRRAVWPQSPRKVEAIAVGTMRHPDIYMAKCSIADEELLCIELSIFLETSNDGFGVQ